jgi:hypothetical protein
MIDSNFNLIVNLKLIIYFDKKTSVVENYKSLRFLGSNIISTVNYWCLRKGQDFQKKITLHVASSLMSLSVQNRFRKQFKLDFSRDRGLVLRRN